MLEGVNKPIDIQINILKEILFKNEKLLQTLEVLEEYAKENPRFKNYYLGAGGVNQTVFNYYHGYDLNYGIKDFDIVYYDEDESYEAEDIIIKDLSKRLSHIDTSFDIKNQARVYIWYNEKYGTNREKYSSVENAVSSWGATVTCIGVRLENNELKVYCPYGLNDVFSLTIKKKKKDFEKENFEARANRWKKTWEKLNIIEW